jgi:hypothetical protein
VLRRLEFALDLAADNFLLDFLAQLANISLALHDLSPPRVHSHNNTRASNAKFKPSARAWHRSSFATTLFEFIRFMGLLCGSIRKAD